MSKIWILILAFLFFAAFLPGAATAQSLPGDIASVAAAGNQSNAQIARGANGYLAVWVDTRSVLAPLFLGTGGPYNGDGLGTMTDIYATRLDSSGKLLDDTPILISEAMYNQSTPLVGWNGQNWLVVWMTQRANDRYYSDVLATRVAPDGTVLDDPPLLIKSADSTINAYTPWSVSSDGTNWAVAYRSLDVPAGIFTIDGLRVAPGGSILDPGGKRLREDFWSSGATNADLAFAGDEYLLTWMEINSATGTWAVRGQRLTLALDPAGSVFTVDLVSLTQPQAPRVASEGNSFFAVWFENRYSSSTQILGARISHTGQVLDPNGIAVTPAGGYSQFTPDVAWDGANYFVAYNIQKTGFNEDIYVTRVTPAGAVLDSAGILVQAGSANQNQPAIAAAALGGTQVVWSDLQAGGQNPQDIGTAAVSAAGAVTGNSVASRGAPRQRFPRIAPGAGEFLAVFQSEFSGQSRILAQRLDAAGNALDAQPISIASGTQGASNPSVAWDGSVFLVVWEDSSQIYGRRLLPSGTLVDSTPLVIMHGNQPDVAALGDTFLVAADDAPTDPHYRFIFTVRVGSSGAALGPEVSIGPSFAVSPKVVALGSRWLVVWEGHPTHDNPASTIVGAFVNPDGSSPGYFYISDGGFDATPGVATAGSTALVAWSDANIFGRRVLADGTLLDTATGIVISNATGSKFAPAVAWDGSEFVLDWVDQRSDPYPNQVRGDIYGARVGLNGNVLDPAGFPVANTPLPEEDATVISGNGSTFFAYAAFQDAAPYAAFRIALRRFPFNLDYSLSVAPGSATVTPGSSATFSVTLSTVGTFSGSVALSVSGLPLGARAAFNPAAIAGAGSSILTITTNARTPNGDYPITILGTSGAELNTTLLTLTVGAGAPGCSYTLSSNSIVAPAQGVSAWFVVSTGSTCAWAVVSNAPWISITSATNFVGSGEVDYSVAANPLTTTRTGTLTAAGQVFTVYQSAVPCSYSISPASNTMPAGGGSGTVSVSTTAGCAWTASSNASWISIPSATSGSGNGSVNYAVAANNSTTARTGSLTIAGQTFTVSQPALLFSVSGRVVTSTGTGLSKVKLTFSLSSGSGPVPASVLTDANGNWSQTGFQAGTTYAAVPSKSRYTFTPLSRTFVDGSAALNFTGQR